MADAVSAETIARARAELERRWSAEGECGSCGWHAALYEHDVTDDDIVEAIGNGGRLELGCRSKDDEDAWSHRGVRITLETK